MQRRTFFQFAAPSIIIMTLLMAVPLIMAIWLGMNYITFNNITDPQFIGWRNYIEVLSDSRFWQSFGFTAALHADCCARSTCHWFYYRLNPGSGFEVYPGNSIYLSFYCPSSSFRLLEL